MKRKDKKIKKDGKMLSEDENVAKVTKTTQINN